MQIQIISGSLGHSFSSLWVLFALGGWLVMYSPSKRHWCHPFYLCSIHFLLSPAPAWCWCWLGPDLAPGHGHQRNWVLAAGWSPAGTSTSPALPRHISGAPLSRLNNGGISGNNETIAVPRSVHHTRDHKNVGYETRDCTDDGTILFLLKNLHFHVRNSIIQGEEGFLLFKPLIIIWEMQLSFGFLFRFAYSQQWWQKYWTNLPRKVLKIIKNNPGTHDSTASIL